MIPLLFFPNKYSAVSFLSNFSKAFMALLCYKNGSVTRERIRNEEADGSWEYFNKLLNSTPRGNFGNIGLYYDYLEITPHNKKGDFRYNKANEMLRKQYVDYLLINI